MARAKAKMLLVEGHDDLISVVELMSSHVEWPEDRQAAPVHITNCQGLANLLDQDTISTALKTPGLVSIGVMLDADDGGANRWDSVRNRLLSHFPSLPHELPPGGLIYTEGEKTVGVWIMPDNVSPGSLETFLSHLVPDLSLPVWEHAKSSVTEAKSLGMPCTDTHIGKAYLYTWLAWQEPPGQLSGRALTKKILNSKGVAAEPFISWFIKLFTLQRLLG